MKTKHAYRVHDVRDVINNNYVTNLEDGPIRCTVFGENERVTQRYVGQCKEEEPEGEEDYCLHYCNNYL